MSLTRYYSSTPLSSNNHPLYENRKPVQATCLLYKIKLFKDLTVQIYNATHFALRNGKICSLVGNHVSHLVCFPSCIHSMKITLFNILQFVRDSFSSIAHSI